MKRFLLLLLISTSLHLQAESDDGAHIYMGQINTDLQAGFYQFSTQLDIALGEEMQDALRNGVAQIYVLELQVRVPVFQLYYKEERSFKQRYELRFHSLSRKYLVRDLTTNKQRSFYTLSAALEYMSNIERLPLLAEDYLSELDQYQLRVKYMLDIDKLPLPLQIHALMNRDWRLASKWQVWQL